MSLTLSTTTRLLASLVRTVNEDGVIDEREFQVLREGSDMFALKLKGLDRFSASDTGGFRIAEFLKATDHLVNLIRHMASVAGNSRIPNDELADLKVAVEHQLIYLVAGYQSGLDRCEGLVRSKRDPRGSIEVRALDIAPITARSTDMSLTLSSSNSVLEAALRQIDSDGSTSPVELQNVRDQADQHVKQATGVSTADAVSKTALGTGVADFLSQADAIVEGMQRVAREARRTKLPQAQRDELKAAVEHQIAYVVAGYQSSIQRL